MKITKTISKQVEVEVNLPVFKKRINTLLDKITYNAYYGEKHNENIEFSIEGGKISHFSNYAFFYDFEAGEEITFDEFEAAFSQFYVKFQQMYAGVTSIAKNMSENEKYAYYEQQNTLKREAMEGRV